MYCLSGYEDFKRNFLKFFTFEALGDLAFEKHEKFS